LRKQIAVTFEYVSGTLTWRFEQLNVCTLKGGKDRRYRITESLTYYLTRKFTCLL
jgi:hypothetical protein